MFFVVNCFFKLPPTCGNIVRSVFSVSIFLIHIGPLPRNQFVIYKRVAMQYIACCRHLCTLLAFCSSYKSRTDNTATSPRPLYQHQIPEIRLPIRMRSEEHTSELQSRPHLVCRLLLEK